MKKIISSFSEEYKDYFNILNFEEEIINKLANIFSKKKGMYILSGNQGVGKTSLKNISLYRDKENLNNLYIDIPFFNESKDLYREILLQLPNSLNQKIASNLEEFRKNVYYNYDYKYKGNGELTQKEILDIIKKIDELKKDIEEIKNINSIVIEKIDFYDLEEQVDIIYKQLKPDSEKIFSKLKLFNRKDKKIKHFDDIKDRVEFLENKINKLKNIYRVNVKLREFKTSIDKQVYYYNLEIKDIKKFIQETSLENTFNFSVGLGINKGVSLNAKTLVDNSKNDKNIYAREIVSIVTSDIKEKQLFATIREMSTFFNISIIIDELDKKTKEEILQMINYNKKFFLETNLTILLITDISSAIYLIENSQYIYIENVILVRSLSLIEFVNRILEKDICEVDNIFDAFELYYMAKFNNRNINYINKKYNDSDYPCGFVIYAFMNSDFYRNLDDLNKEVFIDFYWELLNIIIKTKKMTELEYDNFVRDYFIKKDLESYTITIMFNRLKDCLKNNALNYQFKFPTLFRNIEYLFDSAIKIEEFKNTKFYTEDMVDFFKDNLERLNFISFGDEWFIDIGIDKEFPTVFELRHHFKKLLKINNIDINFIDLNIEEYRKNIIDLKLSNLLKDNVKYANKDFYNPGNGVDDATKIIEREYIAGVIIFYPYVHGSKYNCEKPLRNGILVGINAFDEVVLYKYLGYIGLHSHKSWKLEKFKEILKNKDIKILEFSESESMQMFDINAEDNNDYEDSNRYEDIVFKVCENNLSKWLEKLAHME